MEPVLLDNPIVDEPLSDESTPSPLYDGALVDSESLTSAINRHDAHRRNELAQQLGILDRAVFSGGSKEKAASQDSMDLVLNGREDMYGLTAAMSQAADMISSKNHRNNRVGISMMQSVASYFSDNVLTAKFIYDRTVPSQPEVDRFITMVSKLKLFDDALIQAGRPLPYQSRIVIDYLRQLTENGGANTNKRLRQVNPYSLVEDPNFPDAIKPYDQLIEAFGKHAPPHQVHEDIFRIARKISINHLDGFPSIYDKSFGGVTIQDLDMETGDDAFSEKMFGYLFSMPGGDIFWNEVRNEFLSPTLPRDGNDVLPPSALKVYKFQKDLADYLFGPALPGIQTTPNVIADKQFGEFLKKAPSRTIIELNKMLVSTSKHSVKIDQNNSLSFSSIAQHLIDTDRGFLPLDGKIHNFLQSNISGISANFKKRFGDNPNTQFLVDLLRSFVTVPYEKEHTTAIFQIFEHNVGVNFIRKLDSNSEHLSVINKATMGKLATVMTNPKVNQMAPQTIAFSKDSLPEVLGFSEITFFPVDNGITFFSSIKGESLNIIIAGSINPDGTVEMSSDFGNTKGFKELITYIQLAAIHDKLSYDDRTENSPVIVHEKKPIKLPLTRLKSFAQPPPEIFEAQTIEALKQEKKITQEKNVQFLKGEVFEQLTGIALSYLNPDDLIIPQYCLDVGVKDGVGYYKTRADYKVGDKIFEIKWGKSPENITTTVEKQKELLRGRDLEYNLLTFQPAKSATENQQTFQEYLDSNSTNPHVKEMFELLSVMLLESATSGGENDGDRLTLMRDFYYNVIDEANKINGIARQQLIHDAIFSTFEAAKYDSENPLLSEKLKKQCVLPYSSLEAFFEYEEELYRGSITIKQAERERDEAKDTEEHENNTIFPMTTDGLMGKIEKLYAGTEGTFKPRRVGVYKRPLGIREEEAYREAVEKFDQTGSGDLVESTRNALRKPSPAKIAKMMELPERFRLDSITDPITGEPVFLETWVVDHSSPKPTFEDEQSLVRMYDKYFNNQPALVFLDYLKTWIFS